MTLHNGELIQGEFDLSSRQKSSLRFKAEGTENWSFYHISQVNYIKSFNGTLLYPYGCMVNIKSKYYHLPTVKHLPAKTDQMFFESIEDAEINGYKPCIACFDNSPAISDYQLEKSLVNKTIIAFQSNHEMLYEHPTLPTVQGIVQKVLSNWSETIKGYDYRIQIYRDSNPNAMAIGGGNLYLSSGLLEIIEDEHELEYVIAHEIGHVERRHTLRQFYEYQRLKSLASIATIFVGVAVAATGGDVGDVAGSMTITALISDFASELAFKGYSREMEQEADIMAQLYFSNANSPVKPMISILDKLVAYTTSRQGFLMGVSAFSDHPGLLQRINQIENAAIYKYKIPVVFSAFPIDRNDIESGFVNFNMNYIYRAPSSENEDEEMFYLVGDISNKHPNLSFQIDDITLNFLGSIGQTPLLGAIGQTVRFNGKTDFTGVIKCSKGKADIVMRSLKEKNILPWSIGLSAIVLQKGKDAKQVAGFEAINCTMTIN